jgi:magnesium chelatase family protein
VRALLDGGRDVLGIDDVRELDVNWLGGQARVMAAREKQRDRHLADGIRTNAELTPALLAHRCPLDSQAARLLDRASARMALSARAYDRVRKVARTIADLEGAADVAANHIAEALQFRMI